MKNINDNCNRCGKCCEAICMSISKKHIEKSNSPDVSFLLKNWVPITKKEALNINPYIKVEFNLSIDKYFYKCLMYDKENKKCKDHKNRPEVCSGFPFYPHKKQIELGGIKKLQPSYTLYSKDCSFNKFKMTRDEFSKYLDLSKEDKICKT